MTRTPKITTNIMEFLNYSVLFDLIFGGSGRLIMFGSISLRTVLFGCVVIYTAIFYMLNAIRLKGSLIPLILCFILYICTHILFVGDSQFSAKFDFLSRYLYILIALFYENYFRQYNMLQRLKVIRRILENFTLIFAIFSIVLWIYAFILGGAAYSVIEYGFLRPKVYGSFDLISGGIPRIFLKGSIFIPIGLLFQLDRFIHYPSAKNILLISIYVIAIISTFTTGFYLATVICVMILLQRKHVWSKQVGIILFFLLLLGIYAIMKFGLVNMMINRFSGENYTGTFRFTQIASIIREFVKKPIFGHGFAYEYTTIYGNATRTTSGFEVAWGELLVDTGIIGFLLFVIIITIILKRLFRYSKSNDTIYVFALGLLLICIESFTNPFINNSIGLTYFGICAGIAYGQQEKSTFDQLKEWLGRALQ